MRGQQVRRKNEKNTFGKAMEKDCPVHDVKKLASDLKD
jgi:hypothetical protein